MIRQIRFVKVEIEKTNNWRKGIPKNPNSQKHLCVVRFKDEIGNEYAWYPEKWETNLLIAIARVMVKAEKLNFPLLKNPEPRPDIEELKLFLNPKE